MSKELILGSSGLVGSRYVELHERKNQLLSPATSELDITKSVLMEKFFQENERNIGVVINFAAFTDVEAAEKQKGNKKKSAWIINVEGTENLARVCKKYDKFLVHISTDFVFRGDEGNSGPHKEGSRLPDNQEGMGWYGWTKLEAEKKLKAVGENFAIARISYPYRADYEPKIDFARSILKLFDEDMLYPMFADQQLTPTFIDEACRVFYEITKIKKPGIYHVASSDTTSPFEFAEYLIKKARGVGSVVKKSSLEEFMKEKERTPKPLFGGLDSKKTQTKLGMRFMSWREGIDKFVQQLEG